MKFEHFIRKHGIKLDKNTVSLCREGISIMDKSVDAIHDRRHVEEIFSNLDYLIRKFPEIKGLFTFEVLILAICWHDTWKSLRSPGNPLMFLVHQFLEGRGSAKLFKKSANAVNLNRNLANQVSFVIRKHSYFQFLPTRNINAKILFDLDDIEMWNSKRYEKVKAEFFFYQKSFYRKIQIAYYKFHSRRKTNFPELEQLMSEKRRDFIAFLSE